MLDSNSLSFTNFLLISTLYVSALNVSVAGFRLSPLMTLVRLACFVQHQYDRDELEVSNEVIYWRQSSPGVPTVEGGHGEEMQQILYLIGPSTRSGILGKSFVSVTIHLYIRDGSYAGMWALYEVSLYLCIHLNISSTCQRKIRSVSFSFVLEVKIPHNGIYAIAQFPQSPTIIKWKFNSIRQTSPLTS